MTTPTPGAPGASGRPSDATLYTQTATTLVRIGTQILDWDRAADRVEIQRRQTQMQMQINQARADVASGQRAADLAYNELLIVQRYVLQQISDAQAESLRRQALLSSGPPPQPDGWKPPVWLYVVGGAAVLAVGGAAVVAMTWRRQPAPGGEIQGRRPNGRTDPREPWQMTRQEFEDAREAGRIDADRWTRAVWAEASDRLPALKDSVPADHLHPLLRGGAPAKIRVYRGVPAGAAQSALRPGDWVALTRAYAANHGGPSARVVAETVPAADVVWAGTDENEYHYAPADLAATGGDLHGSIVAWAVRRGLPVPRTIAEAAR